MRLRILLLCLVSMSLTVFGESKPSKPTKKIANLRTKEVAPAPKQEPRKPKAVDPHHRLIGKWEAVSNVCKNGDDFQVPLEIKKTNVPIKIEFKADGTTRSNVVYENKLPVVAAGTFEIEGKKLSLEITSIESISVEGKPIKLNMRLPQVPEFALEEEKLLIKDTQNFGGSECLNGSQSYLVYNRTPQVNVGSTTTTAGQSDAASR